MNYQQYPEGFNQPLVMAAVTAVGDFISFADDEVYQVVEITDYELLREFDFVRLDRPLVSVVNTKHLRFAEKPVVVQDSFDAEVDKRLTELEKAFKLERERWSRIIETSCKDRQCLEGNHQLGSHSDICLNCGYDSDPDWMPAWLPAYGSAAIVIAIILWAFLHEYGYLR